MVITINNFNNYFIINYLLFNELGIGRLRNDEKLYKSEVRWKFLDRVRKILTQFPLSFRKLDKHKPVLTKVGLGLVYGTS